MDVFECNGEDIDFYMKGNKLSFIIWFVVLAITIIPSGCIPDQPIAVKPAPLKIGLLLEGNIYDQGWDSLAYQALRKIERDYNAQVDYFEFKYQAIPERIREKSIEMIDRGYKIIIGHGAVFQDTFNQLGPTYPDVTFIFFNGVAHGSNVYAINFSPISLGFFAGMGAALMTKSGVVGLVTSYPNQLEIEGFKSGVEYVNHNVKIISGSVGSWGDRIKGKEVAERLISQGADILFGLGDGFNIEVINAAREHQIYAIGYIRDQSFIARDTVIFSVIQNIEKVYLQLVESLQNPEHKKIDFQYVDFHTGGQSITPFGDMVPLDVRKQILQALEDYIDGKLKIS